MPVCETLRMWASLAQHTAMALVLDLVYAASLVHAYVINAIVGEPQAITCWTCPNKTDNEACNNWAPERICPTNYTICQTIHRINVRTGESMLVNKRCALPSECSIDMVGCHDTHIPGLEDVHQDCISCCNYAYCNELVPSNFSTALMYSTITNSASAVSRHTPLSSILTSLIQMTLPPLLHVCLTISLLTPIFRRLELLH